jgi:FkbM family methyltransferase
MNINRGEPHMTEGQRVLASLFVYPLDNQAVATVNTGNAMLRLFCLGGQTKWRYKHLLTKEPETIDWLNRIQPGEVLWDVGANIGIYSIYAAVVRQARVLAFEPLASNYYVLNANIELNELDDRVRAYCVAFSDTSEAGTLNTTSSIPGAAGCSFNETINDRGIEFVPTFRQGMLGYSIDEYIKTYGPELPNHLKIDVDGIEDHIVRGAKQTLKNERLASISIELDSARVDYVEEIKKLILDSGFFLRGNYRSPNVAPSSTINNYQFERE